MLLNLDFEECKRLYQVESGKFQVKIRMSKGTKMGLCREISKQASFTVRLEVKMERWVYQLGFSAP